MATITVGQLRTLAPGGDPTSSTLSQPASGCSRNAPSPRRRGCAQIAHESDGFRTIENRSRALPMWGDLGNTRPAMASATRAGGGRANYRAYGTRLGFDLDGSPATAAQPPLRFRRRETEAKA